MQHDPVIWDVINNGFCSFKVKTIKQTFCKNKFNVSGLCSRSTCPLANSQYCTVLEENGICYLYMKTIERAHMPNKLWQKVKLKESYKLALKQIDDNLQHWPVFLIHKAKQRLTKIRQYLIKKRKLQLQGPTEELVPIKRRVERREKGKEEKALKAAELERHLKRHLLDRLKLGLYDDIYNLHQSQLTHLISDDDDDEQQNEQLDELELENENDVDEFIEDFSDLEDDEKFASYMDQFYEGDSDDEDDDDDNTTNNNNSSSNSNSNAGGTPNSKSSAKRARLQRRKKALSAKKEHIDIQYEDNIDYQKQE